MVSDRSRTPRHCRSKADGNGFGFRLSSNRKPVLQAKPGDDQDNGTEEDNEHHAEYLEGAVVGM